MTTTYQTLGKLQDPPKCDQYFTVSPARDNCLKQRVSRDPAIARLPYVTGYERTFDNPPRECMSCCQKGWVGGYNQYYAKQPKQSGMTQGDNDLFYRQDFTCPTGV